MRKVTRSRLAVAAAALVVLAGGAALALALAGDEDDAGTSSDAAGTTSEGARTGAGVTGSAPQARPQATNSVPAGPVLRKRRRDRAERGIQRTVNQLVEGAERGDPRSFCSAVGRPATGSGLAALDACARAAKVSLDALPTSDELSIGGVEVAGARATVTLGAGQRVLLRRRGAVWTVASVTPGAGR